ncbi:unnamed protein product [Linum tenue]|uniref:Uncharacterized protein n=1 Tax=Linum tenue TaxID=586396 RepID=A0AAV0JSG8_9ROSI|nr:unnamed protein product [Linum tenue]
MSRHRHLTLLLEGKLLFSLGEARSPKGKSRL